MKLRIAILDLYEGQPNQGMRCIRQLIQEWSEFHSIDASFDEFEVRQLRQVPDLSYDLYISTGGPGSPLDTVGSAWENAYFGWLDAVNGWNASPENRRKKFVFLICHSFQLVCRHFQIGTVSRRKSTSFGVFPVHVTAQGQSDPVFAGLKDPFYVVDSRDYQVTTPDFATIDRLGAQILCIEKYRPHVALEQAIMGMRFNPYIVGTQFHPEADATGMSMHLQTEERKKTVIEQHGAHKWSSMVEQLNDPDKIMWTYAHVIPNMLSMAWQMKKGTEEELIVVG